MKYRVRPDAKLRACAHPVRVDIFVAVAKHELTLREITERVDRPMGTVGYHLRVLVDHGLVDEILDGEDRLAR